MSSLIERARKRVDDDAVDRRDVIFHFFVFCFMFLLWRFFVEHARRVPLLFAARFSPVIRGNVIARRAEIADGEWRFQRVRRPALR